MHWQGCKGRSGWSQQEDGVGGRDSLLGICPVLAQWGSRCYHNTSNTKQLAEVPRELVQHLPGLRRATTSANDPSLLGRVESAFPEGIQYNSLETCYTDSACSVCQYRRDEHFQTILESGVHLSR